MPVSDYIRSMRKVIGHDLLMLVGTSGVIFNDKGQVLLQLRSDVRRWGLPGGSLEPGEEPAQALVREVWEETGLDVLPERIVGVYGGAENVFAYPNGDQVAITSITFACRVIGGVLRADADESLDLQWFDPHNLPAEIMYKFRRRIEDAMQKGAPIFALGGREEESR